MSIRFEFRDMTDEEYKQEQSAFDDHGLEFNNPPDRQKRFGFVATEDGKFVGASSGLVQKNSGQFGRYFYLSDLLVEKEYRKKGYGKKLLKLLENKMQLSGVEYFWTWTAEYEAASFYLKKGYKIFTRFEKFYLSGHARVGLIKKV